MSYEKFINRVFWSVTVISAIGISVILYAHFVLHIGR